MSDDQEAETADEPADDDGDGIQEGDFVRLAYTARTTEGELVDTTDEEVAEEEGVDTQDQEFSPRVVVVGDETLFADVEDDLLGKAAGDTGSVLVSAVDAFGEYDQEEVRTISADRIPEDDRYPGAHVDIDNEHGHVETIIGGRARVDFNHPLAGDDIEYDYEILEVLEDRVEKAKGLLRTYFDVDLDMRIETDEVEEETVVESDEDDEPETETEVVEKETLYVDSDPQLQFDQQWMFQKSQIAQDLIDRLDLDRVIIQEVIDGQPAGPMGGMMGGMGGAGGGGDLGDLEDAIDEDVDAEELVEELEGEELEGESSPSGETDSDGEDLESETTEE